MTLEGGEVWVEHLCWHPDESILATSSGKFVRLWQDDGQLLRQYEPHGSAIVGIEWHPKVNLLISSSYDSLRLHSTTADKAVITVPMKGSIALSCSPDGQFIACGFQNMTVHLLTPNGDELLLAGYQYKVRELAWDAFGRYLATGGGIDVSLWQPGENAPVRPTPTVLALHEDLISALAFAHQGGLLAAGSQDGMVSLWNIARPKRPLGRVLHSSAVSKLAWQLGDRLLVAGYGDGTVTAWGTGGQ